MGMDIYKGLILMTQRPEMEVHQDSQINATHPLNVLLLEVPDVQYLYTKKLHNTDPKHHWHQTLPSTSV